ncbi:MAG: ABC transporter ATP-binding protein [Desulfobulbaceae bacterium]|uniref:ABC transporter ATP-binding protein n=1 Tax=Candidatus Desulfobia pelagia TaxID=2841692 RepID=A0A8J6TGX1_9BACT|nr:ABC transporter ATP-binding protein [Candidatus Desulfobia pelagia]
MLLEIKNLNAGFHTEDGFSSVLHDVSLGIGYGETVALVGESGSGKSVTAFSVLQLLEKESFSCEGKILFSDADLLQMNATSLQKIRGNDIAMIFQEPMTSLNPVYSIGHQLMEPLKIHQHMTDEEARKQAIYLLGRTGIPDPETRMASYAHQLSGGQRQRVMISMALACRPKLLIADEPTTALDVTIQAQILDLLQELQREFNMAVLLITHDLNMVQKIADRVFIMHQGHIVEEGVTRDIFSSPRDPYTIKLMNSVPKGEQPPKSESRALLTIDNLHCHFPIKKGFFGRKVGEIRAVDGASLTIREGTTYGIVGESGSGKSTLGLCILRLVSCKGNITYNGRDLLKTNKSTMRSLRRELQVVFQDPFSSLSPRLTIFQIISEGLRVHKIGKTKQEQRAIVEEKLLEVGLTAEMADRYPHEFSGGQRQRIAIARAISLSPRFIILDEPTSALDMTIQAQIIDLLRSLQEKYQITYLFISHDLRVVRALADEIAVMKDGMIVEQGNAHTIFANPSHQYTQQLFKAAF